MSNLRHQSAIWFLFYLFFAGCIEPYPSPISDAQVGFLVVDGYLDGMDGGANVVLERAAPLASTEPSPSELGAIVSVEDSEGNFYTLDEAEPGVYRQPNLPVLSSRGYRLHIKTTDEKEYVSDFISAKSVPPIDSITWAVSDDRNVIEISVTTHDDDAQTRYYQWSFEETFQYQSAYMAYYKIVNGEAVVVPGGIPTYECWRTTPSQEIIIASSQNLIQDIIYKQPVTSLVKGSQKLSDRYSILIKQRSLSRKAYDYWYNLQQTTENLGGLYDPQPGQVTGNLTCTNEPNKTVLGYFDVVSSTEKRIFIDHNDLPGDMQIKPVDAGCVTDTVLLNRIPFFDSNNFSLITEVYEGPSLIGYLYAKKRCADCRLQKGVTTKPDFWE
jgi:hypothetical protein